MLVKGLSWIISMMNQVPGKPNFSTRALLLDSQAGYESQVLEWPDAGISAEENRTNIPRMIMLIPVAQITCKIKYPYNGLKVMPKGHNAQFCKYQPAAPGDQEFTQRRALSFSGP